MDPQVVQDVASYVFRAPGPSVRRAQRVDNFLIDWRLEQCGGKPLGPPDRTSHRVDPDRFPDLEVIREKTLTEPEPRSSFRTGRRGCDAVSDGRFDAALPSVEAWGKLYDPWQDVVATAEQDEQLVALKTTMARCLREGWPSIAEQITDAEPARTYLVALDFAVTSRHRPDTAEDARRQATLYADCGEEYFGRFQELLEAQRPAMIERHREVLERFAGELVAIGYVP